MYPLNYQTDLYLTHKSKKTNLYILHAECVKATYTMNFLTRNEEEVLKNVLNLRQFFHATY